VLFRSFKVIKAEQELKQQQISFHQDRMQLFKFKLKNKIKLKISMKKYLHLNFALSIWQVVKELL
jgi:hypothetical protein